MSNTITNDIDKILAMGLPVLRENAVMPRLVNRDYDLMAAQKGSTIDIPLANDFTVRNVTPGTVPNTSGINDINPTLKQVSMSNWKEAVFYMTDKEMMEAQEGVIPRQMVSAFKAVGNQVDSDLLSLYKQFAATTPNTLATPVEPFASDVSDVTNARKGLLNLNTPLDGSWAMVVGPDAEANALNLATFHQADQSGSMDGIVNGSLGRKLGFDWYVDQNVGTHTKVFDAASPAVDNGAGYPVGSTVVHIDSATSYTTAAVGDLIKFANHSQIYTITAVGTIASNEGDITIFPALQAAVIDNEAITAIGSHTYNLAFQRDAMTLVSRPIADLTLPGAMVSRVADPVTGLVLCLEVERQHKQTQWSLSCLYGFSELRAESGIRVLG